jgi:hypothetical protein
MEKELINQSIKLFESPQQWTAFLELSRISEKIKEQWYKTLSTEILNKIKFDNNVWQCQIKPGVGIVQWFLKDFGNDTLSLWLEREYFSLKIPENYNKYKYIVEEIQKPRYNSLLNELIIDGQLFNGSDVIIRETGRFKFGVYNDNIFDANHLAWFAGNETEKYIEQIELKLEPFFTSEATALLIELNSKLSTQNV